MMEPPESKSADKSAFDGEGTLRRSARLLQDTLPRIPRLALVLGSGWGSVIESVEIESSIGYAAIEAFPLPSAAGHEGRLVVGKWAGIPVMILLGRAHFYEGHSLARITFPIRVLASIGVQAVVLTNAAGGINPAFRPGDLMIISDHLNFMGSNPLRGPVPNGGEMFVDLSDVYSLKLRRAISAAAQATGIPLHSGVYCAVSGPSYETPAEIRAFATLGADAVGMSTVPEAIVARQCGLQVAGLSCITNPAAGLSSSPLNHEEVMETGRRSGDAIRRLLEAFVQQYSNSAFKDRDESS